jgi:hypothetical protein
MMAMVSEIVNDDLFKKAILKYSNLQKYPTDTKSW